jgi:hydrogenase assembly chaperone HypC/HupF
MCIGIPMQVVSCAGYVAHCQTPSSAVAPVETVDLSLVGECQPGTWVLVFLGAAREVLAEATALQMLDALSALQLVSAGEDQFDHLFADLVEREPQLPDHLKDLVGKPPTILNEKEKP